jgi:allantoinase
MNDTIAFAVNKIEPRRYGEQLKRNFDRLYKEGAQSGTIMCIPTHNYQVSCPHRLKAFEDALEYITGHSDVWVTTGKEIARYFIDHYYETVLADIATKKGKTDE